MSITIWIWALLFITIHFDSQLFDNQDYLYSVIQTPDIANTVAWSSDGEVLAIGGENFWGLYTQRGEMILNQEISGIVTAMKWSADSLYLGIAIDNQDEYSFIVWSIEEEDILNILSIPDAFTDFLWDSDSNFIIGGGIRGGLYRFNPFGNRIILSEVLVPRDTLFADSSPVFSLCWRDLDTKFYANTLFGIYLVIASDLRYQSLIYFPNGAFVRGACEINENIIIMPSGGYIDMNTLTTVINLTPIGNIGDIGLEFTITINPQNTDIVATYAEDGLYIWNRNLQDVLYIDDIYRSRGRGDIMSISWHPNGEYLAQAGKDGAYVNIWHITMEDLLNSQP